MKGYYVFLADGFEISEALTPVDILRRAGLDLKTVSIKDEQTDVLSSNGIRVEADLSWKEFSALAADEKGEYGGLMVLPGGMPGSSNLAAKEELISLLADHFAEGGVVGAICAAPSVVLHKLEGLQGRIICCYEGFEKALIEAGALVRKDSGVVVDQNLVTARGVGYALEFALALTAAICTDEVAERVAAEIMLPIA